MDNGIFLPYKDKHRGQSCIVFGTGPTINAYKPEYDIIRIGSNEIIHKDYKMHYYFIGDPGDKNRGYIKEPEVYDNYEPIIDKFYRGKQDKGVAHISNTESNSHIKFYKTHRVKKEITWSMDLCAYVGVKTSISFECMQFALWCGFKTIYLVGHDCSYKKGTFYTADANNGDGNRLLINGWHCIKGFIDDKYPAVKVHSINPVDLKIFPEGQL